MEKEVVEMLLHFRLSLKPAKGYIAGLLQLIMAPPSMVLPEQRLEDLFAVFLEKDRLIAAGRDQFRPPAQVARQLITITYDSTVFRKVLKGALVPALD